MRALVFGLLFISHSVLAQVYTYLDADGNRVFTDKPRSSTAEKVILQPSNQVQLNAPAPAQYAPPVPVAKREVHYQVLRITLPEPNATIRHGAGEMLVTLSSEPALLAGHHYRLILDGKPLTEPSSSPVFALEHIDRGTHQLSAEIIDSAGLIVERTPAQPFHMHRMSLTQKRQINPCQASDYGVRLECPLKDKPKERSARDFIPFL